MEALKSLNPFTGEMIGSYAQHTTAELEDVIQAAHSTFKMWSQNDHQTRCLFIEKLGAELEKNKHRLASLITGEMGKPLKESLAEIEKCAWLCRHYSMPESSILEDEIIAAGTGSLRLSYEPLGVLFAIMPWNFPFWQVFRFAVPAIVAGNTVLLKHAPNVTACALEIAELFANAGFPKGVMSALIIEAERSEAVIAHTLVRGVTLTGSEKAGRAVAGLAGKHLKKVVLELGGSDPFIVFDDANLQNSCTVGVTSRMMNAGQVCIAAKRFIVQKSAFEAFLRFQTSALQSIRIGDPTDLNTEIGPMARPDLVENIEQQVNRSIEMGAQLVCGGKRSELHPDIYLPTLLINVSKGMPVCDEETFGPVMIAIPFETEEEAIRLANDTRFGLGCSIWTKNSERAERVASQIEAGAVFVNSLVKSDPRVPFGGVKNSGFGRELAQAGIKEFMNLKTKWFFQ